MTVVKHWIPSPNFRELHGDPERVAMLYHFTGGNGDAVALGRFFQRSHNASGRRRGASHYGVGRDGVVAQYVSEANAAFHAGDGEFPDALVDEETTLRPGSFETATTYSPNAFAIGVEVCNRGFAPSRKGRPRGVARHDNPRIFSRTWELYPEAQIDAVIELTREVMQRHPRMRYCLGHEDVTHQKADPGPVWPWRRITEATGLVRVRYNFAKQSWEVVE